MQTGSLVSTLNTILPLAIELIGAYRKTRNEIAASDPAAAASMLSDAALIDLLDRDASELSARAQALRAKHSPPTG